MSGDRPKGWAITRETFHVEVGYRKLSGRLIGSEATAHVTPEMCELGKHVRYYTFDVFFSHTSEEAPSSHGRYARGDKRSIGEARKAAEQHVRNAIAGRPSPGKLAEVPWSRCPLCEKAEQKEAHR